jgi:hypothetical protein
MSELKVAALYVETNGVYYGLEDVDPWDEARDARLYDGPWPVVAHPPCASWSIMGNCRPETVARGDGGTFKAALIAVETFGGVLEQPRHSRAWTRFGLPRPSVGGWSASFDRPGYATEVDQRHYGHDVRKPTWLYYVGPDPSPLRWSKSALSELSSRGGRKGSGRKSAHNHFHLRSATPPAFRDVLLDMARSVALREAKQ